LTMRVFVFLDPFGKPNSKPKSLTFKNNEFKKTVRFNYFKLSQLSEKQNIKPLYLIWCKYR
jgi:hypothetical protein